MLMPSSPPPPFPSAPTHPHNPNSTQDAIAEIKKNLGLS